MKIIRRSLVTIFSAVLVGGSALAQAPTTEIDTHIATARNTFDINAPEETASPAQPGQQLLEIGR